LPVQCRLDDTFVGMDVDFSKQIIRLLIEGPRFEPWCAHQSQIKHLHQIVEVPFRQAESAAVTTIALIVPRCFSTRAIATPRDSAVSIKPNKGHGSDNGEPNREACPSHRRLSSRRARSGGADVSLAKQCVLDWYGVTLAGSNEPVARILGEEIATSGQGSSSIVGFNLRCSPVDAALINGATSHALDYDDVHLLISHPTAAVLPAVLSIAEAKGRSGMDVLRAFIAGYDAAGEHGSVQSRQRSPAWRTICVTAPVVRA
jgi:hypothetical protein